VNESNIMIAQSEPTSVVHLNVVLTPLGVFSTALRFDWLRQGEGTSTPAGNVHHEQHDGRSFEP
jgi:hypothetical protein